MLVTVHLTTTVRNGCVSSIASTRTTFNAEAMAEGTRVGVGDGATVRIVAVVIPVVCVTEIGIGVVAMVGDIVAMVGDIVEMVGDIE